MSSFDQAFGGSPQAGAGAQQGHAGRVSTDQFRLLVIDPSGQEREFPVRGELLIGSGRDNHIILNDDEVSANHLSIGTDGNTFWYKDLESANGTRINGEYNYEGWLKGGEEIRLGNSSLHFLAPEIGAPMEFDEFEQKMRAADDALAQAAEALDIQSAGTGAAATTKAKKSLGWLAAAFLLYAIQGGILVFGIFIFSQKFPAVDASAKREANLESSLKNMLKSRKLMKQNQWPQANQLLVQSNALAPKDSPFRRLFVGLMKKVKAQNDALGMLARAQKLYNKLDRGRDAYLLAGKIDKKLYAYDEANKLRKRIFSKEVKPMLRETRLLIGAKKVKEARAKLKTIFSYDPNLAAAVDLQQLIENLYGGGSGGKSTGGAVGGTFQKGVEHFKAGRFAQAKTFFSSLVRVSAGLNLRKAKNYLKQVQTFTRNLSRGLSAAKGGRASAAVSSLLKAHQAAQAFGGGHGDKYKPQLSTALAKKGRSAYAGKNYPAAYRNFRRALSFNAGNRAAKSGIRRIQYKARALIKQAKVLRGVDNAESRKLLRKVIKMLPSSSRLHRTAKRLLR